MVTTVEIPRGNALLAQEKRSTLGPILVAASGNESSRRALDAAQQLTDGSPSDVVVLSVLRELPPVGADLGIVMPPADRAPLRASLIERVRSQVVQSAGRSAGWRIELREGDPRQVVPSVARELDARLIVLGIGRHDLSERLFGGEAALNTLRASRVPVLAVAQGFEHSPRNLVIATDFSQASIIAARAALTLFRDISVVHVVHVAPSLDLGGTAYAPWLEQYGDNIDRAFERVISRLEFPEHARVETVTLHGKPSREIVKFAGAVGADLIVTASRGANWIGRLLIGDTASGLLRGSSCSVLAVPVHAGLEPANTDLATDPATRAHRWGVQLRTFAGRNSGRRASLEMDDPELDAHTAEYGYELLGVTYDREQERLQVELGDRSGAKRRFTRTIVGVESIDVWCDEVGRDRVLRIVHGDGQTLLVLD